MHLVVRSNTAALPCRRGVLDRAVAIDLEVDHAVGHLEEHLLLRLYGPVGEQVTNCPSAVGQGIVVMRRTLGLDEFILPVTDPILDIQIPYGPRSARRQ